MTRLKVVDDDQIKEAAELAAQEAEPFGAADVPAAPSSVPALTPAPVLPNPDVSHAQKLYNEDRARLTTYEQGLTLLHNERENLIARFDAAVADVDNRIRDHELCKAMSTSSILTYENETEEGK